MRRVYVLALKDFRIFLADPVAIGLAFIVPLVMILVFGLVFGESGSDPVSELRVLAVNQDSGRGGGLLVASLNRLEELDMRQTVGEDSSRVDSARAYGLVRDGAYSAALIIPRGFSEGVRDGKLTLTILEDPRDPVTAGVLEGLTQKQAFESFPMLMPAALIAGMVDTGSVGEFNTDLRRSIEKNFDVKLPSSAAGLSELVPDDWVFGDTSASTDTGSFSMGELFERVNNVRREQVVGQDVVNPGVAQSTAGTAVMFMLFGVGAIAASLLREMHAGTAQRLLLSGATAGELLLSKSAYAVFVGSVQLVVMMLYSWLVFGLQVFDHVLALTLMIVVTAITMSSVGLLISALSRTEEQASGFQVVIILSMSALGGAMIPDFLLPDIVQTIGWVTPVHWAMQGFTDIFWRQRDVGGILFECVILAGMAAVMMTVSVWIFRKRLATELG